MCRNRRKMARCRPLGDMPSDVPQVRPFGSAGDLDIPLSAADRPAVVTALLSRCSDQRDSEAWWDTPVGTRIASLLRIAAATDGVDAFPVQLQCAVGECQSAFEIMLPVDEAIGHPEAAVAERVTVTLPDGKRATVRPPTGNDQREWRRRRYASRDEAAVAIASRLVIEPPMSPIAPTAMDTIAAALAVADPLVSFTVSCMCPACGQPHETTVDLEMLALRRIAARRQALLQDVHALACAYGWTEQETLAIPPERRAEYRELIDRVTG
jgi:hypothetical protein